MTADCIIWRWQRSIRLPFGWAITIGREGRSEHETYPPES